MSACLETARPCCVSSVQAPRSAWTVNAMAYSRRRDFSSRRGVTVQLSGGLLPVVAEHERRAVRVDEFWVASWMW